MAKKVALLLHHGLGDVMMARKLLTNCCHFFSEDKIYIIVKSNIEKQFIILLNLTIDYEIIVLKYTGSFKSKISIFPRFLSLRYYEFDVLLAIHSTSNILGNIFSKLIGAKISIGPKEGKGYTQIISNDVVHKQDYYLSFLEEYLKLLKFQAVEIISNSLLKQNTINFPGKYKLILLTKFLIISPGTSPYDTHKRWESNKFSSLIELLLSEFDLNIILLGSKADKETLTTVYKEHEINKRVFLVDDLSIKDAIILIEHSCLLIAACTSALHMGDLVDSNMVSIYGPTNYSITGPVSSKNRIVRKNYSCSPCFSATFTRGCDTPKCMLDISVKEVYEACSLSLNNEFVPVYKILESTNAKYFKES